MTQPVELLYAIPVGAVIPWYPPPGLDLPPGFAYCDGSLIDDADSPFNTTNTPNLTNAFVLGWGDGVNPGQTGGSVPYNLTGFQTPALDTSSTQVNSNDNAQNLLIMKNGETSSWRYELTQDNDGWNDGNHHHHVSSYAVPAPGWLALIYIMRIK